MSLDDAPLGVVLDDLASTYETVAALAPTPEAGAGKASGKPGSRLPPGGAELLAVDEWESAVREVDEWALYVAHHLLDTVPGLGAVPDTTPGRLRLASRWADVLSSDPDDFARYAFEYDAREHLTAIHRLAHRGTRRVRTGSACLHVTCSGQYVAVIDGPDVTDDLVCDRCHDRIGYEQWSRWGARSEWVTAQHAAWMLGITVTAVWQRASRGGWQRTGEGRHVRYRREDVEGERSGGASASRTA